MAGSIRAVAVSLILCGSASLLQAQPKPFLLLLKGNLTSETSLYVDPNSSDPIARAEAITFENSYGVGAELRYQFPESRVALGLGAEYLRVTSSDPIRVSSRTAIPTTDGYSVVPVELTGYFIIPASGRSLKISMGGGVGAYFGRRTYSIAGVQAEVIESKPGMGIHVLGGIAYYVTERLSLSAEMKFRDVKFESINRFGTPRIAYQGSFLTVTSDPFSSRVRTDGIVFQLSAGFSF